MIKIAKNIFTGFIMSMKINYQSQNFNTTTSFKSYSEYRQGVARYNYYTTTRFFREDLNWTDFVYSVVQKYKDVDKVNVICHACSDGEEAYSFLLKLKTMFKNAAEKFEPIIAKDFDALNILYGKKSKYEVSRFEFNKMENECGLDLHKYFTFGDEYNGYIQAHARDNIKEKIIFKKADLLNDVENIPPENTILMTRNVWPYIPAKRQPVLAEKLAKHLKPSSLIVLGHFDISHNIQGLLQEYGFENTGIYGVMQKSAKGIMSDEFSDARIIYNKIKAMNKGKSVIGIR